MDGVITDNDYQINILWILKSFIISLMPIIVVFVPFVFYFRILNIDKAVFWHDGQLLFYFIIVCVVSLYSVVLAALRRYNFHYTIETDYLTLKQGIVSKQQRHIPYGVIQNLFVKQDLLDRIFGLASLAIENASQGAGSQMVTGGGFFSMFVQSEQRKQGELVGFSGNQVSIPGLLKQDAETLKQIVLQKMKENPIEDSQSGL